MAKYTGKCLCGHATVSATGAISSADACHCAFCRRQNAGGAFHGVHFDGDVTFTGDSWFKSSDWGERGFCAQCGSTLGWRLQNDRAHTSVALGLFDDIGAALDAHIFVDEAGDYETIPHDAPHKTGAQVIAEFTSAEGTESP